MSVSLVHRGPDGEGAYVDPQLRMSFTHRRLSIIDLDTGDQPMSNETEDVWTVFNGEIYNYIELREELSRTGRHRLKTRSDTEILLHLYEDAGLEFLSRLNGMFAFAIWDEKRGRLILARDRLGVKPLYWAEVDGQLAFASNIKSILCIPGVDREINPQALSHFLSLRYVPEPSTIYKGINALSAAHCLVWEPGGTARIARYWDFDYTLCESNDEESLCDRLEELLIDATRLRMRSDVPVGAYLSGGIDSSLAVALMRGVHKGDLHTFSLGYADRPVDKNDTYYARRIADKFSTTHHEYIMSADEVSGSLGDIVRHLEQPFSGVISTYFLTKLVREHVKVVLSGDGADDMFASYGHHRLVWPLARLADAKQQGVKNPYESVDLAPLGNHRDLIEQFDGMTPWEIRANFGAFSGDDKRDILTDDARAWIEPYSTSKYLEGIFDKNLFSRDPLNAMLDLDVRTALPGEILFFCDRLSMAHSVEARSPYLDYRVAEFAASIPGTMKIKGNVLKFILKKTASRYLPQEIIDRPKEGFVLPNHVWLRGQLDDLLSDFLDPSALDEGGLFDSTRVGRMISEHKAGKKDHAFRIWTLVMYQAWHREFMALH